MKKIYKISEFSPSISTENMGDYIIKQYCDEVVRELFGEALTVMLPTRERLAKVSINHIGTSDYTFVFGTNLLSSNMKKNRQWNINIQKALECRLSSIHKSDINSLKKINQALKRNHIILMGTGWFQYQTEPSNYSKLLLRILLDPQMLHSVRDSYTQKMLNEIGIKNVVNTACPTMWRLNEEHCSSIPKEKADRVITTLTNYNRDLDNDKILLDMLLENYKEVYIWIQAIEDYEYLFSFPKKIVDKIKVVAPSLEAYTKILGTHQIDYIGTRLHGGIKALNCGCRSLILAVDNRAIEISKDTNLPVLDRKTNINTIAKKINSNWETNIILPKENIQVWKQQFGKEHS